MKITTTINPGDTYGHFIAVGPSFRLHGNHYVVASCTLCGEINALHVNAVVRAPRRCQCPGSQAVKASRRSIALPGGCIVIPGDPEKYPHTFYGGKCWPVHRLLYYLETGELPVVVRHTCDNRRCVRLDHLLPGTHKDNSVDAAVRNRRASNKLSYIQAREIKTRLLAGETVGKLASEFGVSHSLVSYIKSGRKWGHIKIPASSHANTV